jgi:hypothetical protein
MKVINKAKTRQQSLYGKYKAKINAYYRKYFDKSSETIKLDSLNGYQDLKEK